MRKLSMKNPGTPAIEDCSEKGSDGVSADGEIAGWPARVPAADEPAPADALAGVAGGLARGAGEEVPPRVLPCACCAWTCGVCGGAGASIVVVVVAGASGCGEDGALAAGGTAVSG